jgi:hypothetical protein
MTVHEEYVSILEKRYKSGISSTREEWEYLTILYGPKQYLVEASMLDYVKKNKNASIRDVFLFFTETAPPGLAPGDTGEDLLED